MTTQVGVVAAKKSWLLAVEPRIQPCKRQARSRRQYRPHRQRRPRAPSPKMSRSPQQRIAERLLPKPANKTRPHIWPCRVARCCQVPFCKTGQTRSVNPINVPLLGLKRTSSCTAHVERVTQSGHQLLRQKSGLARSEGDVHTHWKACNGLSTATPTRPNSEDLLSVHTASKRIII